MTAGLERVADLANLPLLLRVRDALDDEDISTPTAVYSLVRAIWGKEPRASTTDAALAGALIDLAAGMAAAHPSSAASLIDVAISLATGDPHDVLLREGGARTFRASDLPAERLDAYRALSSRAEVLERMTVAPATDSCSLRSVSDTSACAGEGALGLTRTAALACMLLPDAPIGAALRQRLDAEAAIWARAYDFIWGARTAGEAERAAADESEALLVRAAAVLAACATDIERGHGPREGLLRAFVLLVDGRERAWNEQWGPVGLFAELGSPSALALLSPSAGRRLAGPRADHIVSALVAALDAFPDVLHQRSALAGNLLSFALAARAPHWPCRSDASLMVPMPDSLAPRARQVLEAVCHKVSSHQWQFDVFHSLHPLGLPATFTSLRRWLGIDPPGPMDQRITVGVGLEQRSLPLGIACQQLLRGTLDAAQIVQAVARDLPPAKLVYLACDGFEEVSYRLYAVEPPCRTHGDIPLPSVGEPARTDHERAALFHTLCIDALAAADQTVVLPLLLEAAERRVDGNATSRNADSSNPVLYVSLARMLAQRGEVLPARFDLLLEALLNGYRPNPTATREVLSFLPEDRRVAIIFEARHSLIATTTHDYSDLLSPLKLLELEVHLAAKTAPLAAAQAASTRRMTSMMDTLQTEILGDIGSALEGS